MEADDAVEESAGHERGGVRMAERNEVRILGEAVDHHEDEGLAAHLGQPLDEVHGNIRPHLRRHIKGL
jgi:hypothetical protein